MHEQERTVSMGSGNLTAELMDIEEKLERITEECWTSVAGLEIERCDRQISQDGTREFMTGCVQITGSWKGSVVLDCSEVLAGQLAASMFGTGPEALRKEEVRDALGEMTNVISGKVKTLLSGSCQLSIPSVVRGVSYELGIPGTRLVSQLTFMSDGQVLRVTLGEYDPEILEKWTWGTSQA
jgi:chemotaxis protein CheX